MLESVDKGSTSKFVRENEGLFREHAAALLDDFAGPHSGWFAIFDGWGYGEEVHDRYLFGGSTHQPLFGRKVAHFYEAPQLDVVKDLKRIAENKARAALGLPGIGEGWLAETQLFRTIEQAFPETPVVQHGRPGWLAPQHFDVWMPHWLVALEYQGLQHFEPVEFFGGRSGYDRTVQRDRLKAEKASSHGVSLIYVREGDDVGRVLDVIREARRRELRATYASAVRLDTGF